MKKLILLLCILVVVVVLVGCGQSEESLEGLPLEEKISKTVHHVIGEEVNGMEPVKELGITELSTGNLANVVIIREMPLTESSLKREILSDSAELFEKLFSFEELGEVNLTWENELFDQYGKGEYKPTMRIRLTKDTAEKITWDNFDYFNFENVSDQYWQHDILD